MIANLNSVVPDGLVCPNGRRSIEYVDTGRTVLYIAVKASRPGYGVFRLRYRDKNGVTRHISLGNTETITLITAREKAKKLKAEITLGSDPRAEENAKKAVPTFSEFFEEQYIPLVKPRKRTWKKDLEYYELRLKAEFGNKRLNQITRHQIQTLHTRLKGEGLAASTCNHYLKLTHRVFQICLDFSLVEKNPAARIPHFKEENMIENYMSDEELKRFVGVLHTDGNRNVCNILLLLINSGCRVGEILSLRWSDCDLEAKVIRIAAKNSKSRKMRSVPLNTGGGALKILRMQYLITKDLGYCYINFQTGKKYTTISKVFERIKKLARVNIRLHDLRHNFASMLINDGRTLFEVQQILGHSNPKVTQRYAHLTAKTLEAAANCASDRIDQVMKKTA